MEYLVGSETGCGWRLVDWWWAALYNLCVAGCRVIYKVGWWLAIYSLYRWGCGIYRDYRALLVLYSMHRSRLAIYRVGGVGDMRHLK